ncbi:MAG TPA: alpha/beta fold hydrolase [Steroidobacteraceae bacterium]|nr:alpha/beta fold hydrolase [Steroidobacteraceae bacterium]
MSERARARMTPVVYLHGLWMPGDESFALRHRLAQDFGLALHSFRYSTAFATLDSTLERLAVHVASLEAPQLHFVGHSLGGLIIYRFLEQSGVLPPGRVVFLGTPCTASRTAEQAARFAPVAHLMGPVVAQELLRPTERSWNQPRELGIIAGTQPVGVGQFLARFEEDNDGTVAVSETRMPGATDHLVLPVSHLGMLLSPRVAQETGGFLTRGRFSLN